LRFGIFLWRRGGAAGMLAAVHPFPAMISFVPRVARCFPVVASLALVCGVPAAAEEAPPSAPAAAKPLVLKVGIHDIYCAKTACECIADIAARSYDGVIAALAARGIRLEPVYLPEESDLAKGLRQGRFDAVICKPWLVTHHAGKAGAEFERVADLADPDGSATLTGVFLVPKGSAIRDLAGLAGKRVAFGQPDAYEKYHAPLRLLAEKGVRPASAVYLSSCGENLDQLMSGTVDAAVISDYALTASCAVDFAKPEDFRTIGVTPACPLTSVLVDRRKVADADRARLRAALLEVTGNKVPADLCGPGFVAAAAWSPEPAAAETAPPALSSATP
jgi:ABC-type phosphate/phosphonate transport system substrate-binding protein